MRLSWIDTRAFLSMIRGLLRIDAITIEMHESGLALAERYGLSTYDAMIAASALHAGCDTLWSEDMQAGLVDVTHRQPVSKRASPLTTRISPCNHSQNFHAEMNIRKAFRRTLDTSFLDDHGHQESHRR
jgi:hypothetical protein